MAMRVAFGFFGIILSGAFLAAGLLMAFWPGTYLRWVRWSKVENYAPWLVSGWDLSHPQYCRGFRIVGIGLALFGFTAAVLSVWVPWFQ